jgi:hypothetical protein
MPKNDAPSRRHWLLAGAAAAVVTADAAPTPGRAAAKELGPLILVSGPSSFRDCMADDAAGQEGDLY